MPWYAIDAVDDAIDATRRFLFPFSLVRWVKLAVIVLFIGGGSSASNASNVPSAGGEFTLPTGFPADGAAPPNGAAPPGDPFLTPELVIAVAAGIVLLAVLLSIVSTVLEFVFYDALRTNDVLLWGPFKRRFLQGIRLILFQIGVTVLVFAPVALAGYGLYVADPAVPSRLAVFVLAGLGLVGVFLLWLLVLTFTDDFVVPIMVLEDETVLGAWSRFWPTLKGEWVQFLVYLVVYLLLAIGIGIGQSIVTLVLAGIVVALGAIAGLVIVGLLGGLAAAVESVVGLALLGLLVLFVILALAVVILPIRILVVTYMTTYQLAVLGGANRSFMLLPGSVLPDPDAGGDGEDNSAT
ncbi:putative membrane protein [Halalkaliarchaeum sp. AArc-CO]|uniref:DUF7544 domain-containing protein n=1 Tax=unclassified Halalkaliarchaeum TaxID=2678344 RepID=UPI00217E5F7C|nr:MULTISPECIES: hypothetical protein [unclassified Halalkaliarchaeum]MDR5672005.1 hypothetical protein [Halalkaliarchaeum sp. AArc-GB]UWG51510.1 putative membrane protein [Halalkaliarchaeum sp. AArc-CO]